MTNPLRAELADVEEGKLGSAHPSSQHACAVFADEAIRFLQMPHDAPFLCYVPFDAPHDPHIVPDDFANHSILVGHNTLFSPEIIRSM